MASAWSVMVSEFMLQQTPVARVLPVHGAWLARWPTPAALAAEPTGEAVRMWGRLGYPRRALRLHAAATAIVADHGGEVPAAYADLLALPGIGDYTASAIASFAFGQRHVVLDTNVRRVLARAVSGVEFPPTLGDPRGARSSQAALLPTDPGHGRDLGGRGDGGRGPRLHRPRPPLRGLPDRRPVRVARGGTTGPRRPAASRPGLGGDRSSVPRSDHGGAARHRRPVHRSRLEAVWPDDARRERCLAGLVDDRLIVAVGPSAYALPS